MGDKTFPSSHRLLKTEEFTTVFNNRKYSINNGSILILALENNLRFNRLGIIVGKKSVARAVDRNWIKRRLRESFRHLNPLGLDMVVLVRPSLHLDILARKTIVESFDNLQQKALS